MPFVRFRQTPRRLQASLVATHRSAGRVRHEHIASLGSVALIPTAADRIAFWTGLHERLARLANRLDGAAQGAVLTAIHTRIPMPTQDEQQAERLAMAKEDARQQSILAEMTAEQLEGHRQLVASVQRKLPELEASATAARATADAAQDRLAKLERGEDAPVSRPLSLAQIA